MNSYTTLNDVLYCTTHFKQLFAMKGNYDEGFGREKYKGKWSKTSTNSHPNEPKAPPTLNGHTNLTNGTNGSAVEVQSPQQSPSSPPGDDWLKSEVEDSSIETSATLDDTTGSTVYDAKYDTAADHLSISENICDDDQTKLCDSKLAELSIESDSKLDDAPDSPTVTYVDEKEAEGSSSESDKQEEEEEANIVKPPIISCVKVATSIHGYNDDIYETSTSNVERDQQDDLLYENVTFLKKTNGLKVEQAADMHTKHVDMERSFASDDSLENYLQDSEEIEGFDVDAYLREGVAKKDDCENELVSH